MKNLLYPLFIMLCLVSYQAHAQKLKLPTAADAWGEPFTIVAPNGSKLEVRVFLTQHKGTTCMYDIEFNNLGPYPIHEQATLTVEGAVELQYHRLSTISLNVNQKGIWPMEKRECAINLSKKKEKDSKKCSECSTVLYWLKR